jgi:hypothetical protein
MSQAMQGNVFESILQAYGGVKFGGENVALSAEAVTSSHKDAASLADIVKLLAGFLQTNRTKDATAAQVSSLLDTMNLQANGSTVTLQLNIPEPAMEQLFQNFDHQSSEPHK